MRAESCGAAQSTPGGAAGRIHATGKRRRVWSMAGAATADAGNCGGASRNAARSAASYTGATTGHSFPSNDCAGGGLTLDAPSSPLATATLPNKCRWRLARVAAT